MQNKRVEKKSISNLSLYELLFGAYHLTWFDWSKIVRRKYDV